MSERYIVIRNWDRFPQKDVWRKSGGRPPWIKAYTKLLHDDDWLGLLPSQRGILLGLWLMYASSGKSINEVTARSLLSPNKVTSRHFLRHLEELNHAGFIEFESRPTRAPVAPRVEKKREIDKSISAPSRISANGRKPPTEAEVATERERRKRSGWVENLNSYTGCRYVRGTHELSAVYDPLGTERPPVGWPYPRPTRDEIRKALAAA
jgi:hypothetical protein